MLAVGLTEAMKMRLESHDCKRLPTSSHDVGGRAIESAARRFSELVREPLEFKGSTKRRPTMQASDIEERTNYFYASMRDLRDFSGMRDRILFRKRLKEFDAFLTANTTAVEFTPHEQAEWDRLLTESVEENNALKLMDHFAAICQFLNRYQEVSWPTAK